MLRALCRSVWALLVCLVPKEAKGVKDTWRLDVVTCQVGAENGTLVLTHTQQSLCQVPLSPVLQVSISFGCFEPKLNCTNLVIHFLFFYACRIIKGRKDGRHLLFGVS